MSQYFPKQRFVPLNPSQPSIFRETQNCFSCGAASNPTDLKCSYCGSFFKKVENQTKYRHLLSGFRHGNYH